MQACVIIATHGRSAQVDLLLRNLAGQSVRPVATLVVGACSSDLPETIAGFDGVEALVSPRLGLAPQRNCGIEAALADGRFRDDDPILFFDDDFRPAPDWVGNCLAFMAEHPKADGLCGMLRAEGARGATIAEEEACAINSRPLAANPLPAREVENLHGCNMAIRAGVFRQCRFDERLPLHAWLEDADMAGQIRNAGGCLYKVTSLRGVHLGVAAAGESGVQFGYAQIANLHYLARKRTLPLKRVLRIIRDTLILFAVETVRPSPAFHGRSRLRGNLLAAIDLVRGRLSPERILDLE